MGFVVNYVRNLSAIAMGRPPTRPLLFSYYVTHRCPLACRHCSDGRGRPFKEDAVAELTTAEAKALIRILRRDGDTLDFTGGEPLLRADLEDLLTCARGVGFRTVLNTKGPHLPQRPQLMRLSDVLVLSIDSLDPDRLAALIGGDAAAAADTLASLAWVIENRSHYSAQIALSAVAMPDNLSDVRDVLRLAVRHKLGFQLSPQIVGTAVHPALRDNEEFRSLVDEAIAAKVAGAAVLGIGRYLRGIRDGSDYACHPLLMPTIRPDGTVNLPCLERPQEQLAIPPAGRYRDLLTPERIERTMMPGCRGQCRIFCHMALSLLQRHPLAALGELKDWRRSC